MGEVYAPILDIRNFQRPSQGDRRTVLLTREKEITNNLLRYVAEFRLGVKFDEYFYREEINSLTGERYLSSIERGPIIEVFRKAIAEREARGLSTHRETAEVLGFQKLQNTLLNAPENTMFIWVSPPGRKEDGYGPYSFTFIGQVKRAESGKRQIRFIPYRNILSFDEHREYLGRFADSVDNLDSAERFLENPAIFTPIAGAVETPEDIIRIIGEQEKINTSWFPRLATLLDPFIQGYLDLLRRGASVDELRQARDAIENITISHSEEILCALKSSVAIDSIFHVSIPMRDIFNTWGAKAPPMTVGGSCPPREESQANSGIMIETPITLMDFQNNFNTGGFTCPNCKKARVKGDQCFMCGITKQQWADKTGIKCA